MPRKNNKRVGEDGKTYIIPEEEEDDEIREEDLSDDEEARRRRRRRKNGEDVPARKKILSDEYAPNSAKDREHNLLKLSVWNPCARSRLTSRAQARGTK